jgi:hypothetical protein
LGSPVSSQLKSQLSSKAEPKFGTSGWLALSYFVTLSHTSNMVRKVPQKTSASQKHTSHTSSTNIRKKVAAVGVALAAIAASVYVDKIRVPRPLRTSILTGQLWLCELLQGHPTCFHEQMGMSQHVFQKLSFELQLYNGLKNSKYVTADKQLAIFIYLAQTGQSSRMLQERFQGSGDTISMYAYTYLPNG